MTKRFTNNLFGYEEKLKKMIPVDMNAVVDSIVSGHEVKSINSTQYKHIKSGLNIGLIPHKFSTLEKFYVETIALWTPIRLSPGYLCNGFRFIIAWSKRHNIIEMTTYGILLPFFLAGIFGVLKTKNKYGIFTISIFLVHTIIQVIIGLGIYRYRLPIDAFVMIFAFYVVTVVFKVLRAKLFHGTGPSLFPTQSY